MNLNKVLLIISREYKAMVTSRTFIIITILIPVICLLGMYFGYHTTGHVEETATAAPAGTDDPDLMRLGLWGIALAFVVYLFLLTYGAMIMNSVVEEKTNRVVEIIVSSCRPFELLTGKIIGVGLAGLTQFGLWVALVVAGVVAVDASFLSAIFTPDVVPLLAYFVVYFIGGYLLYAAMFAAFGSAVDQASDASQFTAPVILLLLFALYVGMSAVDAPNSSVAVWGSIIPLTSPIVMLVRLPFGVPAWQIVLSIVLLLVCAVAVIWLAARIYRNGILHTGSKASFKQIFSWMKLR